jgi:hypothetical protein
VLHSFGSKVAENAADICHAVRLRLNQSLMATTTEVVVGEIGSVAAGQK